MAIRTPNRTAQTGIFYTGSPDYVDLYGGTALTGMVTLYPTKATDDDWANLDLVGVLVAIDDSNYQVWLGQYDAFGPGVKLVTLEESVGTIPDDTAVEITVTITNSIAQMLLQGPFSGGFSSASAEYYVRTDGSDSNTGLEDTAGGAFLTIQAALDKAARTYVDEYIDIYVEDGTYTDDIIVPLFLGKAGVTIWATSSVFLNLSEPITADRAGARVKLARSVITSSDSAIYATNGGHISILYTSFDTTTGSHLLAENNGTIEATSYSIKGDAATHATAKDGGVVTIGGGTRSVTDTPDFSNAFAEAEAGIIHVVLGTYSGSATGVRYSAALNGVINTEGGGATYFPGDSAGSTATGGQYA